MFDINHIIKIIGEVAKIIAILLNQKNFKKQLTFFVIFNNYEEEEETINQIDLKITLGFTHILTKPEIDNNSVQRTLEKRIQSIEMQESG